MTFTYALVSPMTDLARVRFYTSDKDSANPIWQDEEINMILTEAGNYQMAVIVLLENLIAQLSQNPDFSADWLTVNQATALDSYRKLVKQYRRQWGLSDIIVTIGRAWRPDSRQTGEPNYSDMENAAFDDNDNTALSWGGW